MAGAGVISGQTHRNAIISSHSCNIGRPFEGLEPTMLTANAKWSANACGRPCRTPACTIAKIWPRAVAGRSPGTRSERHIRRARPRGEDAGRTRPPADHPRRQASARRLRHAHRLLVAGLERARPRRSRLRLDAASARALAGHSRRSGIGRAARRGLAQPGHDLARSPRDRRGRQMAVLLPVGLWLSDRRQSRSLPEDPRSGRDDSRAQQRVLLDPGTRHAYPRASA